MFSIELKYALQIVAELERARTEAQRLTTPDVRRKCGYEIPTFNNVMFYLNRSGWVDNETYISLLVDIQDKSLFDLAEAIGDPAASEHDYMYGWSSNNLRNGTVAVDISQTMCEEYRDRLRSMPLTALIGGAACEKKKRKRRTKGFSQMEKVINN